MSLDRTAMQLRKLKDKLENVQKVLKNVNVGSFEKVPGVKKRPLKGNYSDVSGELAGKIQSIEKNGDMTFGEKATEIIKAVAYYKLQDGINVYLPNKKLTIERVMRDSEIENTKNSPNSRSLTIVYTPGKRISYSRYAFTKEYRDPKQWNRKTGAATDRIHIGSHRLFNRYAVTSVNVLGKNIAAGRRGTPLEGLGYEPIGKVPKHTASPKDYKIFIRIGYPGRLVPHQGIGGRPYTNPDDKLVTLKGRARHPVYTSFLGDSSLSLPYFDSLSANAASVGKAIGSVIAMSVVDAARN